jgi:hypothetical protein
MSAGDSAIGIASLVALSSPWVVMVASVEGPASAVCVMRSHLRPDVHTIDIDACPLTIPGVDCPESEADGIAGVTWKSGPSSLDSLRASVEWSVATTVVVSVGTVAPSC